MSRKRHLRKWPHARKLTYSGSAYRVNPHTVVKTGENVFMAEAEAMRFVKENTTIPVPRVRFTYQDRETGYSAVVMDYIEGETLEAVWEDYTEDDREEVIVQLREYMQQLRQCKGTFIGSIDGTCCNDAYFCGSRAGFGPFPAEPEFNEGILEAMRDDCPETYLQASMQLWLNGMKGHESVLTHNDFEPSNILVDGTEVVGILDWESAGYYPEYWEYCKAMRRPTWNDPWVVSRAIDRILTPYPQELSVVWSTNDVFY